MVRLITSKEQSVNISRRATQTLKLSDKDVTPVLDKAIDKILAYKPKKFVKKLEESKRKVKTKVKKSKSGK
jgi:hypothetical protein